MNRVAKKGFTIIELMLAMGFISILLLAVAMTVIQIGSIYNKGLMLKEVNQTARDVATDFTKSLQSSPVISLDTDYVTTSAGGRVCLGTYSYIWNTIAGFKTNDPNLTWKGSDTGHTHKLHFVKVPDSSKIYCAKSGTGGLTYLNIRPVDEPQAQELVLEGDHDLNITQFALSTYASAAEPTTGEQLYTLNYAIGSGDISAMNADQTACLNPGQAGADADYCSVQQFSLVIRAGNGV